MGNNEIISEERKRSMHVALHNIVSAKTFKDRSKTEVASRSARFDKVQLSSRVALTQSN